MRLVYGLVGYVRIKCQDEYKNCALNICMEHHIPYTDVALDEFGCIYFTFKYYDFKKFRSIAVAQGVEFEKIASGGLPHFLYGFRHRTGLMAGMILGIALVVYFSGIIWDVRIAGNSTVTTGRIEEILEEHGVSAGKRIRGLDVDEIQNKILIESDEISFIAINLSGNIASVEIRENKKTEEKPSGVGFVNIVAKKSGIIEDVRVYEGNVMVKSGETVNKGDILIGGVYDSQTEGFRYTRASGAVMAKTVEEYYIEIPLKYEKKQYTGVVNYEKYLNFFGKTFNISKKCGKDVYLYDTIYNVDSYALMDKTVMPISISTVSFHEYEMVRFERTVAEAEALAYLELEKIISQSGAEFLIKKTVTPRITDDCFSIHCVVVYIEDIAKVSEFFVDLQN